MDVKPFVEAYKKAHGELKALLSLGENRFSELDIAKYENTRTRIEKEKDWQERSKMMYEFAGQVKQDLAWYIGKEKLGGTIGDKLENDERFSLFVNVGVKALEDAL